MMELSHLDEEALAELQDVMEDEFDVLIQTYISDSSDRLSTLKRTLAEGDLDAFAKCAHSFKGSSINIGAPRLGELCRRAEEAAHEAGAESAVRIVDQIDVEFLAVKSRLASLLETSR